MNFIDMRTITLSYTVSNAICAAVMTFLWLQNRKHFAGIGFCVANFVMQFAAIALIALRGTVPDFVSMVIANTVLVLGMLLLYVGLERFVAKPGPQIHNVILLAAFIFVHTYFAIIQPNLAARNINVSLGLLMLCAQSSWLMLYRADAGMRPITRSVGVFFLAFCAISIIRIIIVLVVPPGNDFFNSTLFEKLLILAYQVLFVILTFGLSLMVNHRLIVELEQDIAERRQVEHALSTSEEKFFKAFQSSPDAIIITRLSDDRITEVNEGFYRVTGYSQEEALSGTSLNLGLWANPQERERLLSALQEDRSVHNKEYDLLTKSGRLLAGLYSGEIIYLNNEAHILSMIRDITERKQAEEALRQSEALLQESQQIAHLGSWELDLSTHQLKWSDEVYRIFGLRPQEFAATYEAFLEAVHPDDRAAVDNAYASSLREERDNYEIEHRLVRKTNGEIRYVHEKCEHVRDSSGKIIRSIGMVHDITERRQAEEALRRTNAELQERNEELDAFGHTVAHDLKNPLSNIIGFAYILGDKENQLSEEETRQAVETVKQASLKMDSIIEELMLLSGLRKAEVKMEPLDMANIVAEIQWRLGPQIRGSQARLTCPTDWPKAMGYAPWVGEVWVNYVSNAIKYGGSPPHIELGATQEGEAVRFWIRDNGPGLSPEEQTRLFAPFERLEQASLTGHGLGLSIVRRIVERMSGQVHVESTGVAGEGSIFSFTLPADR